MTADRRPASLAASVLTAVAVAVAVGAFGSGVAAATNTGAISECTTIDTPGRYVLDGDVDGSGAATCLAIASSDVVLDGGGHTVTGSGSGVVVAVWVVRQ